MNKTYKNVLVRVIGDKSMFAASAFNSTFFHPTRQDNVSSALLIADLNAYWRLELGSLKCNTFEARTALIDTNDFDQWLGLFVEYVLPDVITVWERAKKGKL